MKNPVGILIVYRKNTNLLEEFEKAKKLSISSCQLCMWDVSMYEDEK